MGVYNIVNYEMSCPTCGALVTEFQTKEGAGVMDIVKFNQVNNFHAICSNCQSFIEFYYAPEDKERDFADYKLRVIRLGTGR